jgi:hypothetical protein
MRLINLIYLEWINPIHQLFYDESSSSMRATCPKLLTNQSFIVCGLNIIFGLFSFHSSSSTLLKSNFFRFNHNHLFWNEGWPV